MLAFAYPELLVFGSKSDELIILLVVVASVVRISDPIVVMEL